jgi:hypothetical protein
MGAGDRTEETRGSAVMREHGAVVARVCMALLGDAAAAVSSASTSFIRIRRFAQCVVTPANIAVAMPA